jgi:hypothetical protein
MLNPYHTYMPLSEFLTRYRDRGTISPYWLWSYLGREYNAGRYREWYVIVPGIENKRFFIFER